MEHQEGARHEGGPFFAPPGSLPLNGNGKARDGASHDSGGRDDQAEWRARLEAYERRLRERTEELEAFTHAVAHDLKAPLRSIEGFSTMIQRRHAASLPPEARELFEHVIAGTKTLGELIDGLMALSRLTTAELREDRVDLSKLAESVVARLRRADPDRHVAVVIQPGLSARGDESLLGALLENLLSNAWKFTAHAQSPQIVFARMERDGTRAFVVRDNGAGFEPSQTSRLFQAFQRLHSKQEFSGHGLGLTSVKRIVERHGGRVWAEGEPGKGAAFYFTLPPA